MTEELPNPGEEGYRTAHLQKKDGTYADIVMPADIFTKYNILLEGKRSKSDHVEGYYRRE